MNSKFTAAKPSIYSKLLTVLIPGAGSSDRLNLEEPKSLISIKNETLLNYQVRVLNDLFQNADFIFVGGFGLDKIMKIVPKNVRVIENENYTCHNTARSIDLGLKATITDSVLIVFGDLYFTPDIFKNLHTDTSSVIFTGTPIKKSEIGIISENGLVTNMSFKLKTQWAQIVYLTGKELKLLRKIAYNHKNNKMFGFELINKVIDMGGQFKAVETESQFTDIDTPDDLKRLRKWLKN